LNGQYDLGVVTGPVNVQRLIHKPLFQDPHVAVLPKGHRLARRTVTLKSLVEAAEPMVSMPPGFGVRDVIDHAFAAHPIRHFAAEVESIGALLDLVRAGLGMTVLPLSAVTPTPRGVTLCRIEGAPIMRTVCSIQRVGDAPPPFGRRLLELMTLAAREGRRKFDNAGR
jgi:DNA-binding transcriptional LysR family regulator